MLGFCKGDPNLGKMIFLPMTSRSPPPVVSTYSKVTLVFEKWKGSDGF